MVSHAPCGVDALTMKVRGRSRGQVQALVATGVKASRHRKIFGLDVASAKHGAGWSASLRELVAGGLTGCSW